MKKVIVFLLAALTAGCLMYLLGMQFRKENPAPPAPTPPATKDVPPREAP